MDDRSEQGDELINQPSVDEKLLLAIKENNFSEVKSLINQNGNVNYRNEQTSALEEAVIIDEEKNKLTIEQIWPFCVPLTATPMTDLLIRNKADVNYQDPKGDSLLYQAGKAQDVKRVARLKELGAHINDELHNALINSHNDATTLPTEQKLPDSSLTGDSIEENCDL